MSTGKKLYLDPLTEDNFSQLWDNSDGSTIVLNFEEPLYQDRFTDADVKLDMFSAYRDKFTNSQTDVSWVTPGTSYPSDEEIWYGHKMPCPDMICKSPFPWAKRVSYEMVRVGPTIEEHNWPSDVDVKPCKLFSCFINKIQGKDHRLAIMLSLCENEMLEHGVVRFCNDEHVKEYFINTRDKINEYHEQGNTHGLPNYYQVLSDYLQPHWDNITSDYKWSPYGNFDPEYQDGAIDIVTLTDKLTQAWCDKTFKPLLLGKPLVLIGRPNVHTRLWTNAGYEIYDEVFDAKLDNEVWDLPNKVKTGNPYNYLKHVRRRANYYNRMLSKLYDMDTSQKHIDHIWKITRPKATHNLSNLLSRFFDNELLPDVIRDPEFKIQKPDLYNRHILVPRMKLLSNPYYAKFISDKAMSSVKQEYLDSGL
jgi:hypothetical protein